MTKCCRSNQFSELSEAGNSLCEAGGLKRFKVLGHSLRWILEAFTVSLGSRTDDAGVKVQQVCDELVGMLSLDSKLGERIAREVGKVAGYDDIRSGTNRGGKNVTIILVGKLKIRNQVFVVLDEAVPNVFVHLVASFFELIARLVGILFENIADPLFVDFIGPFGAEKVRHRQVHQQAAELRREENARIKESREVAQDQ